VKRQHPYPGRRDQALGLKPVHVLGFLGAVLAILMVLMLLMPEKGIEWGVLKFRFPRLSTFFSIDTTRQKSLDEMLAELEGDTSSLPMNAAVRRDGQASPVDVSGRSLKKIQYPDGNLGVLYGAFAALENAREANKPVRVLHFGDSQIEGDRMTSMIRSRLQEQFGGNGPGLLAVKPLVNTISARQECSETMKRYTMYGQRDKSVTHNRYGAMALFSRFAPIYKDSSSSEEHTGWFSLEPAGSAAGNAKQYNVMKLHFGFNYKPFVMKLFVDDNLFWEDTIPVSRGYRTRTWKFTSTPRKIMMIMSGQDSPDLYGVSLEGSSGVSVDNISMRGSSGTQFTTTDPAIFKPMLDTLNPALMLLQYGGNSVPYIESKSAAEGYGRQFKGQIKYLQEKFPGVGIIVIGPSDMATKIDGTYQSYPNLIHVRDALRQASFDCGVAYFDIYEVMGGHNSMVQWVQADDPLAGNDYVHFNPRGARVVADAFIKSLMEDYQLYQSSKKSL